MCKKNYRFAHLLELIPTVFDRILADKLITRLKSYHITVLVVTYGISNTVALEIP